MKNNSPFTCKSKIQFIDCDSLNNGISIDQKVLPKQVRVYLTQGMKCPMHTIIKPKFPWSFSFLGYTATVTKLVYKESWQVPNEIKHKICRGVWGEEQTQDRNTFIFFQSDKA